MIQCLGQDTVKVHFEYDKRQTLAGAEACFDHTQYVAEDKTGVVREDNIPFTKMDVCNKQSTDRKRCFFYSYQVTLHVSGPPILEPRLYTKVFFESLGDLVILPGDQVKTSLNSDLANEASVRVMPEIYSPNMPTPIKERYQRTDTRLPCDDRKVADKIVCENFYVHCTDP